MGSLPKASNYCILKMETRPVPDTPIQAGLDSHPVIRWLMVEGRKIVSSNDFLEAFASCLRRAGIGVTRITTGVPILHPQIFSFSGLWQLGKGTSERLYRADNSQFSSTPAPLENSPIKIAYGGQPVRCRLTMPADEAEFPRTCVLRASPIISCCRCRSATARTKLFRSRLLKPADFQTTRLLCLGR